MCNLLKNISWDIVSRHETPYVIYREREIYRDGESCNYYSFYLFIIQLALLNDQYSRTRAATAAGIRDAGEVQIN